MTRFTVPDMDCQGCVGSITRAVQKLDPAAAVTANLEAHLVDIESVLAETILADTIEAAGFTVAGR